MTRSSALLATVMLVASALACSPVQVPLETAPAAGASGGMVHIDWARLAKEIDPGAVEPLTTIVPEAVRGEVESRIADFKSPRQRLDAARQRLATVEAFATGSARNRWIVDEASLPMASLLEGVLLLERTALSASGVGPDVAATAAILCGLYRNVGVMPPLAPTPQMLPLGAEQTGTSATQALWSKIRERTPRLFRAVAAQTLRRVAEQSVLPSDAADVLFELSDDEMAAERFDRASDLAEKAFVLTGSAATVRQYLTLARARFHVLAVSEGKSAL